MDNSPGATQLTLRFLTTLFVLSAVACNGPFVLLPGGELDGELASTPSDWTFASGYGTVQLETNPEDPYSVNIAYIVMNGTLYINAGDTETQWVQHIAVNPLVRFRLDGSLYELRAERVNDDAEIAAFGKLWTERSSFLRDPAELGEVWVYRLVAR